MKESELALFREFFNELKSKSKNNLHERILSSAIDGDQNFLLSMEKELGEFLLEVIKNEN